MAENKDYKFVDHYEFNEKLLKKAFAEARKIYKECGFMHRTGSGKAPAITTVGMVKAWMNEGHPFTCDHSKEVCTNALKVLETGRKAGVPILHTTTGHVGKQQRDLPHWDEKIPMSALDIGSEWLEIDPKLKPLPEEPIVHKEYVSNFFGAHLAQTLNFLGIDTLVITGTISYACVRHAVMDSTGYGFKTVVPEGTVNDHVSGVIGWSLFGMGAKFAGVVPVDEVVEYLEGIDSSVYTKHERSMDQ